MATATDPMLPTGNWMARIKVGGTEFNQQVKIETIKPNRLKINLDVGSDKIISHDIRGNLEVKWLHGAPGKNLKAEFDVTLIASIRRFQNTMNMSLKNPQRLSVETQSIFEGNTDAEGKAVFRCNASFIGSFPGFMTAVFRGKGF